MTKVTKLMLRSCNHILKKVNLDTLGGMKKSVVSPMLTHVHACPHMPTHAHSCPLMPTHAHTCPQMPTNAHTCPHMPTHAHSCPLMSTHAHACPRMPTHAHECPQQGTQLRKIMNKSDDGIKDYFATVEKLRYPNRKQQKTLKKTAIYNQTGRKRPRPQKKTPKKTQINKGRKRPRPQKKTRKKTPVKKTPDRRRNITRYDLLKKKWKRMCDDNWNNNDGIDHSCPTCPPSPTL